VRSKGVLRFYAAVTAGTATMIAAASYISRNGYPEIQGITPGSSQEEERTQNKTYTCDMCGQGPMKKEHDLEKHVEAKHRDNGTEEQTSSTVTRERLGETTGEIKDRLGIDHSKPEKESQSRESTKIETPDAQKELSKQERLMSKWSALIQELEQKGRVQISRHQHYGSLRGPHVAQRFKRDAHRMDLDFDVEVEVNDVSTIRKC